MSINLSPIYHITSSFTENINKYILYNYNKVYISEGIHLAFCSEESILTATLGNNYLFHSKHN